MDEKSMKEILDMLSKEEIVLIKNLDEKKDVNKIMKELDWDYAKVLKNCLWLENKKIAKIERREEKGYIITEKGKEAIKKGLPERRLFNYLKGKREIYINEIPELVALSRGETNIAIGTLRRLGLIGIITKEKGNIIKLVREIEDDLKEKEMVLNEIENGKKVENERYLKELEKRGIIKESTKPIFKIELTELGKKIKELVKKEEPEEIISNLTKEIIEKGAWIGKRFKKYDIKSKVPSITGGRKHPLYWVIDIVREAFIGMGFEEIEGPWIETAFWNMDSMFIPQDHPARDVQDTFYLNKYGKLPDAELIKKIKEVQENGFDTGSEGYGVEWNEKEAMKIVLRSHTTAVTFRMFAKGIKPPIKAFCIGRVFRNEKPDRMHLPEFHQIEGFVAARGLNLRHLMGYLKEFYKLMGIKKLRFKPTYNPYTEPSMEIFAYHPKLNYWIEIANSGIFRPEARRPYNIDVNIVAWGLALERLASLLYETTNIRDLLGHECDLNFIRNYSYKEIEL